MNCEYLCIEKNRVSEDTLILLGNDLGMEYDFFDKVEVNGMEVEKINLDKRKEYCDRVVDRLCCIFKVRNEE